MKDILVPYPLHSPRKQVGKGMIETDPKSFRHRLHIAMPIAEMNQLRRAARLSGCSISEFARWAVFFVARDVIIQHGEEDDYFR